MIDPDLIRRTLPLFADGRRIHRVSALLEVGFPEDFIERLAARKNYRGDLRVVGVHSLDALRAIARSVGADIAGIRALKPHERAKEYIAAIRAALAVGSRGHPGSG